MSSFICWCHVFLGRRRRLVPGIASSITLRVTLVASRLWTCPNQRRRPLSITSSIGERCNMRRISSFCIWSRLDTPRIPRSILISVGAIFLLLVTFIAQHSLPYVRAGLIMVSYIFVILYYIIYCNIVLYYSQVACGMTEISSTTTAWNVTALVQFYCIVLYCIIRRLRVGWQRPVLLRQRGM